MAWWQNPLNVMANKMSNGEDDNLRYGKEYRNTK